MKTRMLSRQNLGKGFLGIGLSLAVAAASTIVASPAVSDDESPTGVTVSSASAAFLNASVGGSPLLDALTLASLSASATRDEGEGSEQPLILADILNLLDGATQSLTGLSTSFLNITDVTQRVQALNTGAAYASSAAVSGNNAQNLGLTGLPTSATIDLAGLLGNSISDEIAQLALEVGAISSSAYGTGLTMPSGNYNLAGARLVLKSALVEDVASTLTNSVVRPLDQSVAALVGSNGALTKVINGLGGPINTLLSILGTSITPTLALDVNLESVLNTVIERDFGTQGVTINLSKGLVSLDLDELFGGPGSLNNLPPNTSLLTPQFVSTVTTQLSVALSDLVSSLLNGVTDALNHSKLKVGLDVRVLGFSSVLPPVAQITLNVDMSLGELVTGKPLAGQAPGVAGLTLAFGGIPARFDVATLTKGLLVPVNQLLLDPKNGALGTLSRTVLPNTLAGLNGVLDPVLTVVRNLVDIKVNVQRVDVPGSPTAPFTQTALEVTVLGQNGGGGGAGGTAGSNAPTFAPLIQLGLASSTVQASVVNPTVDTLPVARGQNVTVQGGSFDGADTATLSLYRVSSGAPELVGSPVEVNIPTDANASDYGEFIYSGFQAAQSFAPGTELFVEAHSPSLCAAPGDTCSYVTPVFVPTTAPTLTSAARVVQGGTVNAQIGDFTAGSDSTIDLLDVNNVRTTLVSNVSGGHSVPVPGLVIPNSSGVGTAKLIAASAAGDYAETAIQIAAAPRISVNPAEVTQGESFQISGTGFASDSTVSLEIDPHVTSSSSPISVATDSSGTFSTEQIQTAAETLVGNRNITATGTQGLTATGTLNVLEKNDVFELSIPTLTASPEQVMHGDTVTITGEDFVPNTSIVLTYRDANNDVLGISDPIDTSTGEIETTLVVPENAAVGSIDLRAKSNIDQQAHASVNLTVRAAPNPSTLIPRVAVTPKQLKTSQTPVSFNATGFPNGTVDVTVTGPNGFLAELRGATVIDNSVVSEYAPNSNWPVGSYRLRVTSNNGSQSASDTFTVIPTSDQQSGGDNTDPDWNTSPGQQPNSPPAPTGSGTPAGSGDPAKQDSRTLTLTLDKTSLSLGETQTATATGFKSGEIVAIGTGNDKVLLPDATANADGTAEWKFDITEDFAAGQYSATAYSVTEKDGSSAQYKVNNLAPASSFVPAPSRSTTPVGYIYAPPTNAGKPALAQTGLDSITVRLGVLALLFMIGGAVLSRRRQIS